DASPRRRPHRLGGDDRGRCLARRGLAAGARRPRAGDRGLGLRVGFVERRAGAGAGEQVPDDQAQQQALEVFREFYC
ncbi:MAG: hypothetical protein ACOCVM_04905, partial [Desulfovibrionaceae bacterium]